MTRPTFAGLGLALLAALAYGANIPFARMAAGAGVSGSDIVFYRAFLILALLAIMARFSGAPMTPPRGARGAILGLGLGTAAVALCYISSVAFIPVGVATIVYYTFPLIILIASPFVDGERLTLPRIGVFLLAFGGLGIAIGPSFAALDPRGLALAGTAALGAAVQFFCAARATRAVAPALAGFWTQVILIPVALGVCIALGGPAPPAHLAEAAWPVGMHVGLFVLAFVAHLLAARRAPPAALGLIFCAEPVTSILTASVLLGEALKPEQWQGGALVLAAVAASVIVEARHGRRRADGLPGDRAGEAALRS